MIPDSHFVEKGIEFVAGSFATTLGLKAAAPIFRVLGGFVWDTLMDHVKDCTYYVVKEKAGYLITEKIGLKLENHLNYLAIKLKEKELQIHYPNRDRTHERYTLLTHYMHPERFSQLLQERIEAATAKVSEPEKGIEKEVYAAGICVPPFPLKRKFERQMGISIYD